MTTETLVIDGQTYSINVWTRAEMEQDEAESLALLDRLDALIEELPTDLQS